MAGEESAGARLRRLGRILYDLEHYFRSHPRAGQVFSAPLDVVLSHYDIKNVQGPPALIVEVLSKSTRKRDAQTKRRLFERTGVREYWLVDPELDTVQVFRPSPQGKHTRVAELSAEDGDALTTPQLPGCEIELRELFRAST